MHVRLTGLAAGLTVAASAMFASSASANIDIVFDYSYDTNGFFDSQSRRDRLEEAAAFYENAFTDTLSPVSGFSWTANMTHPGTLTDYTFSGPDVGQDQILIYAGGYNFSDGTLGHGGPGGFPTQSGTVEKFDALVSRGQFPYTTPHYAQTDFGTWGGSLTFDTAPVVEFTNGSSQSASWYWGDASIDIPDEGSGYMYDFLSIAVHEIGHVLGFGTANSFENLISGGMFTGAASQAVYGGPVPMYGSAHWATGILDDSTAMDPSIGVNERRLLTMLDYAGFDDLGWDVDYDAIPEPTTLALMGLTSLVMLRRRRTA